MTRRIDTDELARLRRLVDVRLGLHLGEVDDRELARVLERCAGFGAGAIAGFLERLESPAAARELDLLAGELTVGETFFFRDDAQLRAFAEIVRSQPGFRRVLSAGCASGEEAYSLAMSTHDCPAVAVVGFDVNPGAIARARRARYGAWALRQTPTEARARWFREERREWIVDDAIRSRVSFEVRNLVDDAPEVWQARAFDVVFLRNVIMYFSREQARALLRRVAGALQPGGHLFLGHAESLRDLSDDFELQHTHGTFYYRRRAERPVSSAGLPPAPVAPLLPLPPTPSPEAEAAPRPTTTTLAHSLELLRQERFVEALALLSTLPADVGANRDAELVRAVLLTHTGSFADASSLCEALVAADDRDAAAHYLLALLHEQAGELDSAVAADRTAARLDPAFAMPHLHMGLVARRAGDRRFAERALTEALRLLDGEDPTRMLFFGGGLGREALVELCRAELRAAKGQP